MNSINKTKIEVASTYMIPQVKQVNSSESEKKKVKVEPIDTSMETEQDKHFNATA